MEELVWSYKEKSYILVYVCKTAYRDYLVAIGNCCWSTNPLGWTSFVNVQWTITIWLAKPTLWSELMSPKFKVLWVAIVHGVLGSGRDRALENRMCGVLGLGRRMGWGVG